MASGVVKANVSIVKFLQPVTKRNEHLAAVSFACGHLHVLQHIRSLAGHRRMKKGHLHRPSKVITVSLSTCLKITFLYRLYPEHFIRMEISAWMSQTLTHILTFLWFLTAVYIWKENFVIKWCTANIDSSSAVFSAKITTEFISNFFLTMLTTEYICFWDLTPNLSQLSL